MNESRVESSPRKLAANRVQLKASGVLQPQLKTNRKDQHNSFQTENVELRASTCMLYADGKCEINLWLQLDLHVPYLIRMSVSGTLKSSLIPEFEFASVLPSPLCRVLFCSRHSVFLISSIQSYWDLSVVLLHKKCFLRPRDARLLAFWICCLRYTISLLVDQQ